ncbi:MAG: gliding motility protein GldN [Psychroflexus sp.]|nr:gliding motility protein GldN [Psychroflexus sp.]MDR9448500.1 gliding motility protein GldN [Psychroflexus sp.]
MNYKAFYASLLIVGFVITAKSQVSNILNADTPDEVNKPTEAQKKYNDSKPLAYGYISDRDVLWSKVVWETIDLNQKVNFPLLFPTESRKFGDTRRSLFQVLLDGIEEGTKSNPDDTAITEVYATSYFNKKREFDQILDGLKAIFLPNIALDILGQFGVTGTEAVDTFTKRAIADSLEEYPNLYSPELIKKMEPYVVPNEITGSDIQHYLVKGIWYFDKRQGEMKYRILGIAPAGYDIQTQNPTYSGDPAVIPYFWVWYPDARNALHKANVLNKNNSAKPLNFDQLLTAKRFDSKIYKTENVYQDRKIDQYVQDNAMMQLLESNRIKEEIRNFELDMWNY